MYSNSGVNTFPIVKVGLKIQKLPPRDPRKARQKAQDDVITKRSGRVLMPAGALIIHGVVWWPLADRHTNYTLRKPAALI